MAWYLYGITVGESPAGLSTGLIGLDDADIVLYGGGDLRVIASVLRRPARDLQNGDVKETVEAVRRHDEALLELSRTRPVLPVRFGTVLADQHAIDELLEDRGECWAKTLAAVTGADEWVIRVDAQPTDDTPDPADTQGLTPGHAFFAKRKSQAQARTDARQRAVTRASELHTRLGGLARGFYPMPVREPATLTRGAYLVDRGHADSFVAAAESTAGVTVVVQGPLPPYRFSDGDAL